MSTLCDIHAPTDTFDNVTNDDDQSHSFFGGSSFFKKIIIGTTWPRTSRPHKVRVGRPRGPECQTYVADIKRIDVTPCQLPAQNNSVRLPPKLPPASGGVSRGSINLLVQTHTQADRKTHTNDVCKCMVNSCCLGDETLVRFSLPPERVSIVKCSMTEAIQKFEHTHANTHLNCLQPFAFVYHFIIQFVHVMIKFLYKYIEYYCTAAFVPENQHSLAFCCSSSALSFTGSTRALRPLRITSKWSSGSSPPASADSPSP